MGGGLFFFLSKLSVPRSFGGLTASPAFRDTLRFRSLVIPWVCGIKLQVIVLLLLLLSRFSRVRLCATPETAAHQAPLSLGFSRQEHWSGLPFPSPVHESEK